MEPARCIGRAQLGTAIALGRTRSSYLCSLPRRIQASCSPLRSSFALHSHRTRGAVLPLITVRVVCHTCVHILRSLTLSEFHLPASFSSSSSAFAALRISCQIQDTHNPTCRMLIGIPRRTVYTIYSSLQQSTWDVSIVACPARAGIQGQYRLAALYTMARCMAAAWRSCHRGTRSPIRQVGLLVI